MRKISFLLSVFILFQSCFSYKSFTSEDYSKLKSKKVEVELKSSKVFKGKVKDFTGEKLIVENPNMILKIYPNNIKSIKKKTFSVEKTAFGTMISFVGLYIISSVLGDFLESIMKDFFQGAFNN